MSHCKLLGALVLGLTIALSGLPALAQAPKPKTTEKELKEMAVFLAKTEKAIKAKDVKAYCLNTAESPGYLDYMRNYCKAMAQVEKRDPAQCTDPNVKDMIKKDLEKCYTTTPAELEQTGTKLGNAHETFRKEATSIGLDGNKLLDEARAAVK